MNETPQTPSAMVDPLDTNVSDINPNTPLLVPGLYDLKIEKAEKRRSEEKGTDYLSFQLKTTTTVTAVTGEELSAGAASIFHIIGVTPTEKYSKEAIGRSMAGICQAAGVNGTVRSIVDNPVVFIGRTVRAKVAIDKGNDQFPEKNVIKAFVKA